MILEYLTNGRELQLPRRYILLSIVFSQFACTSLWFAGNAVIEGLVLAHGIPFRMLGWLLSAVQVGFIMGTLLFAVGMFTDRIAPSKIFFFCALAGAFFNGWLLLPSVSVTGMIVARLGTGVCLAGIYPVGMKIASDYYQKGLGKALGYLVGALVLGTAFPYLLKALGSTENYKPVISMTSALAVVGGVIMITLVPSGPYAARATQFRWNVLPRLFRVLAFRKAAIGYFGHMWELYAFWGYIAVYLSVYEELHGRTYPTALITFVCIAIGTLSCIAGGYVSVQKGSSWVAYRSLFASGTFCILSPLFLYAPFGIYLLFVLCWGIVVISDSPQFSSSIAQAAPPEWKGTGLTVSTCIGFAITVLSIQIVSYITQHLNPAYMFVPLSLGPIVGVWFSRQKNLASNTDL